MARLLLVDDETTLLALLRRYLERYGHQVETCSSAEAALVVFGAAPEAFDLVIADLTLPGMNGEDMIKQLRRKKPGIPALLASGYPHEPQIPGVTFLQKPFLPQNLVEIIDKTLKR